MEMSLPVSQYEALLAEVRGLRRKAQRVQQLARPLLQDDPSFPSSFRVSSEYYQHRPNGGIEPLDYTMESLLLDRQHTTNSPPNYEQRLISHREGDTICSEDECGGAGSSTKMSVSSEPVSHRNRGMLSLYHGTWPVEKSMWNSEPASLGAGPSSRQENFSVSNQMEVTSVMSFASSSGGVPLDRVLGSAEQDSKCSSQQLEAKMDVVHSLLAMLGGQEHVDMGETLLALSTCPESCLAMRQSGCIPLLVQLVQSDRDSDTRRNASQALHNLVNSQPDEKLRKRECRILKLLDSCRGYTEALKIGAEYRPLESSSSPYDDEVKHPVQTVAHLMKLSFDEGHRQAICQLGGIHTIASLVEVEHAKHGSTTTETHCVLMRRYSCMALTNLTFGDSGNKALLCSFREFMRALVVQLQSSSDELRQVTASVLRNLSWRADSTSKGILREVGSVTGLMKSAMLDNKENTLKSILSALWNLSAHCTENKSEICAVDCALGFLVDTLRYRTPSKSMAIVENSGGILRNVSSQIAVREDYREILRNHGCLQILLEQLKSPSLTIVSNACGTLWNLSAKSIADQETLWKMGAPAMLRSLNHSKHKMIAMGSSAALKNLLSAKPQQSLTPQMDSTALSLDLPALPTLGVRKQKALLQDLDQDLAETYENVEKDSPIKKASEEGAFASLNLNEPSTSFDRETLTVSQSFGSTSLPFINRNVRGNPRTFVVRNTYTDAYVDEISLADQPIDYSRKYSESKPNSTGYKPKKEESFGIYAETDLDQPTDYSLRYAEDDSDSDVCTKITKVEPQGFVQDTVKTYCTEGTPYETPFNFSTATSMSDLRIADEKPIIDNDKSKELKVEPKIRESSDKNIDEKDHCSTEDVSEMESRKIGDKIPKSELSSGLMSPEKPVNYCEEGTPGYFSRVSSFGSLNSIPANETATALAKSEAKVEISTQEKEQLQRKFRVEKTPPKTPNETQKAVKFERAVNYAEETPLMFSRSSSLASLDSIEQHSIHDDRSSIVSDLSRLNSGIVSPSELPDSPTQTVPPSPKPRKTSLDFSLSTKSRQLAEGRPQPLPRAIQKPSVFEDNITKFKEESTPIQFSTATSLSSLTIDDVNEETVLRQCSNDKSISENSSGETVIKGKEHVEKKDAEKGATRENVNDFVVESEDDEDEDILAACINIGMQNTTHNQSISQSTSPISKLPLSNFKYTTKSPLNSGIPLARPSAGSSVGGIRSVPRPRAIGRAANDPTKTYHNEGTITIPNVHRDTSRKDNYLSDDSSNLSGDNDNILAECIQSGMPKAKRDKVASFLPRMNSSNEPNPINHNPPTGNSRRGSEEATKVRAVGDLSGRRESSLPPYLNTGDEVESYAVENSPCHFSLRSSLSDLTVDGSVAGLTRATVERNQLQETSSVAAFSATSTTQQLSELNISEEHNVSQKDRSRRDSLSSVSVESFGSLEAERALLEQCISSGMPKSNPVSPAKRETQLLQKAAKYQEIEEELKPKNVNAASVAGNTAFLANVTCPDMSPVAAGVEENQETELEQGTTTRQEKGSPITGTVQVESAHTSTNSGSSGEDIASELSYLRCQDSKIVDNRMLDPDAMIESLDRFTAELVSQASRNKDEDRYKLSTSDNTWNEDSSQNEITFPSISGSAPNVITFSSNENSYRPTNEMDVPSKQNEIEQEKKNDFFSNDFSSLDTTTMTESTLIAIEASKMASVFQNQAEMNLSLTSAASLELDHILPPSNLNSLTNSAVGLEKVKKSPRFQRKKSLPMVRKALNNSLNHGSSLESLENHTLSNLDHVNPPSDFLSVFDMEGSMTSVASLPSESEIKADFLIDGIFNKETRNNQHPIFNIKRPFAVVSELENIDPPSLFNEITDFCCSLADVPTEAICGETADVFEDCYTHITSGDRTLQDPNETLAEDLSEFSDAQATPLTSDISSPESTPKKIKNLSKLMTKQRRNLARDRYKTYTIAAEMVTREEVNTESRGNTDDYDTANEKHSEEKNMKESTYELPTYTLNSGKLTPKERRQINRSRFETRVVDPVVTALAQQHLIDTPPQTPIKTDITSEQFKIENSNLNSNSLSPTQNSPIRTKLSIRRSFMQKRLENNDRFKTQTLSESSFSPDLSSSSPLFFNSETKFLHLQKEANLVLKTIRDSKMPDGLLDTETLSLVSNDDDSEHNSGGSACYRTYRRSWSVGRAVSAAKGPLLTSQESPRTRTEDQPFTTTENGESNPKLPVKPKIVKSAERRVEVEKVPSREEQPKGIRGRRKPLYSKTGLNNNKVVPKTKTTKMVNSNLVKNVTSTLKANTPLNSVIGRPKKSIPQVTRINRTLEMHAVTLNGTSPKTCLPKFASHTSSPKRMVGNKMPLSARGTPLMERQGTFTKDDPTPAVTSHTKPNSKIPTPSSISKTSKIARSLLPSKTNTTTTSKPPAPRGNSFKSVSSDRALKNTRVYNRSTSADSREPARKIQSSPSTQSLKNETKPSQNGAVKKSAIPGPAQRSNSNSSLASSSSNNSKKKVTSKIASLWKKIEESKNQTPKKDTRVWIQAESESGQAEEPPPLIRSNTFENKDVVLRDHNAQDRDQIKRLSRLGSFIVMDENEDGMLNEQMFNAVTDVV